MPLEIKELVIKAIVEEGAAPAPTGGGVSNTGALNKDAIIEECVHKVLELIKLQNER